MPSPLKPSKARPLKLPAGLTLEQGFGLIARNCLRQIRANEAGLRLSDEPEFVHQLRVGLRRLRSALSLFKPWITLPPELAEEIAWLGLALGAARDAEVLAGTTLPAVMLDGADLEDLSGLQKAANSLAQRRRRKAALALKAERCLAWMAGLESWLMTRGWRADSPRPTELDLPLEAAAKQMLKRRSKKLSKQARALPDQASPDDRHRLRIAVKKLRYAREFFRSLEGAATAPGRTNQITALQDLLGQLNDANVGRGLLLDLGQAQPRLAGPAGFARGLLQARSTQNIAALTAILTRLKALD